MNYLPQWDVDSVWAKALPMLQGALAQQTAFNADGLHGMLLRGEMHLWMNDNAAAVTQIQTFQLERVCVVVLCGGAGLEASDETWQQFTRYARSYGCAAIMVYGRAGWSRVIPGLVVTDTIMRFKL